MSSSADPDPLALPRWSGGGDARGLFVEPLFFLGATAVSAVALVVVLRVQDSRRARSDEARVHSFPKHLRALQGPDHGDYLRDVDGRPE